jgi:cell cycle sensor histidine kinase DivJ
MPEVFVSLFQTMISLLGFMFIFSFVLQKSRSRSLRVQQVVIGLGFGIFGIFSLIEAVVPTSGIVSDFRGPILVVATVYGGLIGGMIPAFMMGVYRYFIVGGVGAVPGSIVLPTTVLIVNLLMRVRFGKRAILTRPVTTDQWILLALLSGTLNIFFSLTLPAYAREAYWGSFIVPALLFYPLSTYLLGWYLQRDINIQNMDEQLRLKEARFRTTFNESIQFIALMTPDGTMLEANKTALDFVGSSQDEIVGKHFADTHWWRHSENERKRLRQAIILASNGQVIQYRTQNIGKDDHLLMIDFSIKPIRGEHGEVVLLVTEGHDITDRLIAEEQRIELALEKERMVMIQRFIEDSSHHFRTPITILMSSIHIYGKLHQRAYIQTKQIKQALANNNTSAIQTHVEALREQLQGLEQRLPKFTIHLKALNTLIDDLLALVRFERDERLELATNRLDHFVNEEVQALQDIGQDNAIRIHTNINQVEAYVDEEAIRLVIRNLLENAIRYSKANSTITITLTNLPEHIFFEVQDEGIGIAQEAQSRVFERFYRADNAMQKNNRGTGLGLALVKRIVEAHQGKIVCKSELNVGTTMTVTLPHHRPTSSDTQNT